ncbi:ribokinase [Halovulum sp. GXIMD14794]
MGHIIVLGVFVADTAYRADRQPRMGETILGKGFALGPGGKGSNQAIAAARLGADVRLVTRLGRDNFAEIARRTWADAGVTPLVTEDPDSFTGAAFIFVEEGTGDNAIIVTPGAAGRIAPSDLDAVRDQIESAAVFMTQLEQPLDAAMHGLSLAREAGVTTILNPAPAADLPEGMLPLCSYLTPNETEAEALSGLPVASLEDARRAADALLAKGVGAVVMTLGERGALYHDATTSEVIPARAAGPVVETTGAGDAFNGAFATGLAAGLAPLDAVRQGCAAAGISVTRPGAGASMPSREEVDAALA